MTMHTTYSGGSAYYFTHAVPLALIWGLLFFILGLLLGGILWRARRLHAKRVEGAVELLEEERRRLQSRI